MSNGADFTKMVPGFDFLQQQMKTVAAGLPDMSQWIAPTLSLEEIEKRIGELRTVQFWLEQNAKLLAATVQSLEVQRMTLSTLKSMNLPLTDVRDALKIPVPGANPLADAAAGSSAAGGAASASAAGGGAGEAAAAGAKPAVDPMQWWGALTQQFTEIAAKALRESTAEATRNLAAAAAAARPADSATPARAKAGAAKGSAAGSADAPSAASARRRKS